MLTDIRHRLARSLPPEPLVVLARSGGDEFCVLTTNLKALDDFAQQAQDVLALPRRLRSQSRVEEPDNVREVTLAPTGVVTVIAQPGWDIDRLIDQAVARQTADRVDSGLPSKPDMIQISI